ncbi:hypothetical protein, partial [Paenibacillus polymyxa]|uniref:WD40/YVTN/BNR-like repeat-containing protein n=1 Tax=Paenibacillus polymyxa TaxID=1406 RepID=UPI000495B310
MKKKTSVWVLLLAVAIVTAGCETGSQTSSQTGQTAQNEQKGAVSAQANGSGATVDTPKTGGQATTDTTIAKVRMDNITALRLIDGQSGWIGGNGWIARTDASASGSVGSTWNVQYQGQGTVQQIFALNGQQGWAVMADSGSLLATRDGGKRWEVVGTVPEQGQTGFLHFVSSKEGFSGNQFTKDGGQSWSSLPVPGHMVGQPYYHDRQNGWGG